MHEKILRTVEGVINSAYGTDPRHYNIGKIVADHIMHQFPIPWKKI